MSAQKFFRFAFALNGDRAVIPDEAQSDGSISYNQGFGPDYERDPVGDPLAKRVPRDETNQYLFDLSDNVRQYQLTGSPEWVTAAQNGGSPVSYAYAAQVRYDAGAGVKLWISTVANNTTTPGADASWALFEPFNFAVNVASNAEVQAGTLNTKIVTPLNLTARTATTGRTGLAALATQAEVTAGTDTAKIVTPATLAGLTASETVSGLSAFATTAEVQAGVSAGKSISPAGLVQRIATAARTGIAALASQAEVIAGTNADKIVTPATLQGKTATTGRLGITQHATNAEVLAGVSVDKSVTPAGLRATVYTAGVRDELEFPIGHILFADCRLGTGVVPRNSEWDVFLSTIPQAYTLGAQSTGTKLNGKWAARGISGFNSSEVGDDFAVMQRIS